MVIKNLLLRADPPFEEIMLVHCNAEYTKEYDDIDVKILAEIPAPKDFEGEQKTLVIIDDIDLTSLSKQQKGCLDRLFGSVSTHMNVSVHLTSQDPFNIPASVRRCSNVFVLYKSPDLDSMACVSRKTGFKSKDLHTIFKQLFKDQHESLWIDLTTKSPYPLRKNGYQMIQKNDTL